MMDGRRACGGWKIINTKGRIIIVKTARFCDLKWRRTDIKR